MGSVPAIYWYLLVVAFFAWMVIGLSIQSRRDHAARMTALDILRTYAEKGIDPPASLGDPLTQFNNPGHKPKQNLGKHEAKVAATAAASVAQFSSHVFMTGVAAAICWWRVDAGGPQWVIIVSGIAAAMFAAGAVGHLTTAIITARR